MDDTFSKPFGTKLMLCWLGAAVLLFVVFGFRFHGMNAVVMADEWYYSSLSRLTAASNVSIPAYLYNAIYHVTTACGTGFLDCARLFNTVFFLASAPFIYLVGRRFLSANLASLVTLLAMLGPVNSYTAYFMPESFYFCTFWVTSWAAFRFNDNPGIASAALLGLCVGALALIKLHALFLVPSIVVFMTYSVLRGQPWSLRANWRQAGACVVVMLAVSLATRLGFGYMAAGPNGLSLTGTLYAAQAGNSTGQRMPLLKLIELCLFNMRGHLSALTILFGVPIAALLAHATERRTEVDGATARSPLMVYSVLILVALLGMTVAFTAFVAGNGYETNVRLHMRYYNFALPLLVMVGATQVGAICKHRTLLSVTIGAVLAAMIIFTIATSWQPFTPSLVDSPDFRGMSSRRAAFFILGAISLLSLVAWMRRRDLGARIFLFGFMPLYVVAASINIDNEVRAGGAINDFDRAGIVARQMLTSAQRDTLAIVGTDVSGMFRTRFHVDNILVWQQTAPENTPVDLQALPAGTAWLLLLGDYPTPPGATVRAHGSGYALVELATRSQPWPAN